MADKILGEGKRLEEQDDGTFAEAVTLAKQPQITELLQQTVELLRQIRDGINLMTEVDLENE